ncbi:MULTISPECIES: indole-3-glycerol phosphate synthase TrpC [Methanobacterium]|jgi:indole-3-glycerol phosphate synthase|uniref:Indole-3-glycerol phosphate synthase n=1 Tax=Methanobacterium subterraneum TaxID=59277 RepID=A0A7K4DP52_9EURY|nr:MULTISPECIES: indole-3-glycerol-phosphate synthase [Methanobacterium]AUB58092.1 indole-3-glycerol phosphate synthase [Methanobacterium sp. MZ-A1]MBW4256731.1 indole-3-glycerol-phosphate synthase [Methanobacterium sp. YSL]NMO10119.1 indole-3-glycerol-phosphate synthase [Methanobacterium subterraneum]
MKFNSIISERKRVLEIRKKYQPLADLKENIKRVKLRTDFRKSLNREEDVSIISEYKPASPSMGEISQLTVGDVVPLFEEGGASAVSVLTEESFFKSNIDNLKLACRITRLPLLRKDFILDPYQIYEARAYGASAVLLMADLYPDIREGIELCNYLDLDALVECKNQKEINMAIKSGAEIIGINNRDFNNFKIDLGRTEKLASLVPSNITLVSESGVQSPEDVKFLSKLGVDAILVGSSIMQTPYILEKVKELVFVGKKSKTSR